MNPLQRNRLKPRVLSALMIAILASLSLSACGPEKPESCKEMEEYLRKSKKADREGNYQLSARLGNLYSKAEEQCDKDLEAS
ncbi:hypothetical protein G7068_11805 [Leucobacter viscericola]|uniref:Uncharacterized protein n=1 Tax=Leucobacter viscericola TaxID=2714935 RepID=A0A6G7XGW9_9MICO|nr:hypothetical protein [Leucobacter viscericola]QIK63793.1 hypothetical protein G7068_11805 [Leucobacter viscericola]